MKKILITLAILPLLVSAQLTPDSLLGCYAGTYMYKTEFDNDWTTIYADTLIVFNVDTIQKEVNGTLKDFIALGWKLVNSDYRFTEKYTSYCTYGFGFVGCPYSIDTVIDDVYSTNQKVLMFYNNDSIFFVEGRKLTQTSPDESILFDGKKYTSTIPDSLQSIYVTEVYNNYGISIFPNPTKNIVNVKSNNNIKQYELYNIEGVLVKNEKINISNFEINISKFNNGIYFIKLLFNDGAITRKIIKL